MPGRSTGPFDLSQAAIGLLRDGSATLIPQTPGPPPRIDGLLIGAPVMTRNSPHGGEMHPDGDEVLYLITGHVDLVLEEGGSERALEIRPGQGVVVPKGVWHRVLLREPSQLLHVTPGPGGECRPVRNNAR